VGSTAGVELDFAFGELGHVHADEAGAEQFQLVEPLQRTHAVAGPSLFHLVDGFVHVHVNGALQLSREHADARQRAVGHGVGRMGREESLYQVLVTQFIVQRQALGQVVVGPAAAGAGKIDQDHAHAGSHAALQREACGNLGKEVHIVEAGDSAAQHFRNGQLGPVVHEGFAHPAAFQGPDVLVQPIHHGHVVRHAS